MNTLLPPDSPWLSDIDSNIYKIVCYVTDNNSLLDVAYFGPVEISYEGEDQPDPHSLDLTEEFADAQSTSGVDVEALIHGLADVESDMGEICGIAADEFSQTQSIADMSVEPKPLLAGENPEPAVVGKEGDLSWCVPTDIKFSQSSQAATEIFSDFLDAFIEEGASELEKLEDAIGEWEKDISSESAYAPIPRVLHTLKGIQSLEKSLKTSSTSQV